MFLRESSLKRLQACFLQGSRLVGSQFSKLYNIIHAILIGNDELCNLSNFDENKSSFLTSENLVVQFLRLVLCSQSVTTVTVSPWRG